MLHVLHMTLGHKVVAAGAAAVPAVAQQARQEMLLGAQEVLLNLQELVEDVEPRGGGHTYRPGSQ
jgi:hypothetical protein